MLAETQEPVYQFKELDKFGMFTDAPGVQGRRSRLVWSSYRGNPRISVFTSVPDDTNKGVLSAPMNPETFDILMGFLENVSNGAPGRSFYIKNMTRPRQEEGSKTIPEKIHVSDTWVGKDKDGIVWISVRAPNRPVIAFQFLVSDFHALFKGNNEPFTPAEASVLQAHAVMNGLKQVFGAHAAELRPPYDPEAAKAKRGGAGSGNGYKAKPAGAKTSFSDLDDDIPY